MITNENYYQLALSLVPGIGPIRFKKLLEHFTAEELFKTSGKCLRQLESSTKAVRLAIEGFDGFKLIDLELKFIEKHDIQLLSIQDKNYPKRLLDCADSPPILFFKGNCEMNAYRSVAIIGTRVNTEYGKRMTEDIVAALKPYNVMISSGLAFGIDIIAHKACVKNDISTIGVLASGMDKLYPKEHRHTAMLMQQNGGLLTEFLSGTLPNRENFPTRNRIVAGMAEATLVIETDVKGGSIITAELAHGYNRDVFALPGRITDTKSSGCNALLKNLKAQIFTSVEDMALAMGWIEREKKKKQQRQLFIELSMEEQCIIDILKGQDKIHIDSLLEKSQLSSSQIAAALLNLEMQTIIQIMPGKLVAMIE
jgi:DNA processing protein